MPGLGVGGKKQPQPGGPPVLTAPSGGRAAVAPGGGGRGGGVAVTPSVVGVGPVGGGGGGGPFGAGGPPASTNTAQNNPAVSSWLEKIGREFEGAPRGGADPYLEESIGNLRTRQATDTTERAIQRATGQIKDQAAGQKAMLASGLGRRGLAGSGAAEKLSKRVDDDAARRAAGAATDITLGRERDLDNLAIAGHNILASPSTLSLARSGQLQNLLAAGMGGANTLAQIGLADRGLNLQQWQTLMADERARAEMAAAEQARREGQALALKQMEMQAAAAGLVPSGGGGSVGGNTRGGNFAGFGRR